MTTVHLISSMGTSPAVLTEALWWLDQTCGLEVTGLTCVGTSTSRAEAERQLFAPEGALDRLRLALDKDPSWLGPRHVTWEAEPLESTDNRNRDEAVAMDRAFRKAILKAQDGQAEAVVACISGGRKTMSSCLQQAMTLLARPKDWAFHILLRLPEDLPEGEVIQSKWAFPGDDRHPRSTDIQLDGIEVPLVRLRSVAQRAKVALDDFGVVDILGAALADLAGLPELVLDLETLHLHKLQRGERYDLGKLAPKDALILGAYIRAGRPLLRSEARPFARHILERWSALDLYSTREVSGSEEELEGTWDALFNNRAINEDEFAQAKSKLHRKLAGWLMDPETVSHFKLEPREGRRAQGPRAIGFSAAVYEGRKIRLVND